MLGDYVGDRGLAAAAARFACGLFGVSCLILLAVPLFLQVIPAVTDSTLWLSQAQRLLLFILCLLPPCSFVYCHWLLERRFPFARFQHTFAIKSILALLLFLAPAALVVLRFHLPSWMTSGLAFAAIAPVVGLSEVIDEIPYLRALHHARQVMWTPWRTGQLIPLLGGTTSLLPKFASDPMAVRRSRQAYYLGKERIAVFQRTLSCPYSDAVVAARLVAPHVGQHELDVLDLGGAEGRFTRNFFDALGSQVTIRELRMSDPVDWAAEYSTSLNGLGHVPEPLVDQYHTIETATQGRRFDLIVASHSLYALLDAADPDAKNPVDQLCEALCPGGSLIVVLSSARSHAYAFKARAVGRLFGKGSLDVTAEDLGIGGRRSPARAAAIRQDVDNLIDLTECFSRLDAGRPDEMHSWLSYFLRVDIRGLDVHVQHELEQLLRQHCVEFSATPQCLQDQHRSGRAVVVKDRSVVLTHRTAVMLWRA